VTATEWATVASLATAVGTLVISVRNVGTGLAVMPGWHVEVTGQPQQTHPPLEDFTSRAQPAAWPSSEWTGRPPGARSVICCPQPGQGQVSGG